MAAGEIRRGSLASCPEFSQVSPRAFPALADINEAGCLTFDSQEGGARQRSYVTGFMRRDRALDAARRVNSSGRIAFSPVQVAKWIPNVPKIPVCVGTAARKKECVVETWAPHFIPRADVDVARKQVCLNKSERVCVVHFIDPEWGRSAFGAGGLFEVVRKSLSAKE